MSDYEERLAGARFFLECARNTDLNRPEYRWYIQATASFAIAATEILYYEYGVNNRLFLRNSEDSKRSLRALTIKFPSCVFFQWLFQKLEMDVPSGRKSFEGRRYAFLREERNSILHQGERDKRKVEIHQPVPSGSPSVNVAYYFVDWDYEPCELVCEKTIAFVEKIIDEAKKLGYL